MGENSKIEWTHHTFNPWWGCVKVSPACEHCYAESFSKAVGQKVWGPQAPRRFFKDKHWNEPLKWNKAAGDAAERHRVFCASMADVCEDRPDLLEPRARLMRLIEATPYLDWLLLTKRPERFVDLFGVRWGSKWPSNVWAGTTAENQEWFDKRVPELLKVPAFVRFISAEPLLGPIQMLGKWENAGGEDAVSEGIHWVIVGGESGRHPRPMHPDWALGIQDQCQTARIAFLFKQWGEWVPAEGGVGDDPDPNGRSAMAMPNGPVVINWEPGPHLRQAQPMWKAGKKAAGRLLAGRTWDAFPDAYITHMLLEGD